MIDIFLNSFHVFLQNSIKYTVFIAFSNAFVRHVLDRKLLSLEWLHILLSGRLFVIVTFHLVIEIYRVRSFFLSYLLSLYLSM